MAPEIASIRTTQELLGGVSRQTVYNLVNTGRLRKVNLGRRAFITMDSVSTLLSDMKAVQPK
jgi:hypothetical protein